MHYCLSACTYTPSGHRKLLFLSAATPRAETIAHRYIFLFLSSFIDLQAKADAVAGLTVGVLLIPQALAYAQLAHLPPVYGLYTSIIPTLIYAFFGGSNTMSLG